MATESDDADSESLDDVLRDVAVAPSLAPPALVASTAPPPRRRSWSAVVAVVVLAPVLVVFVQLARSHDAESPGAVASPAAIDASTRYLSLAPFLDILEDPSAALTLDDVRSPETAARFARSTNGFGVNYGLTASALWVRLAIENRSAATIERWLVLDTATIETIHVFRDGEPPAVQGVLHPRDERELPRRSYSFRIALAPHQTRTVFVRLSGDSELQAPLELWDLAALLDHDRAVATGGALLYGVMLAMALYNVLLFFFVRDRAHLYYAGHIAFACLWFGCLDGMLLDLLPDGVQVIPHSLNLVANTGSLWFLTLFLRRVLELPRSHRRLDHAFVGWMCVTSAIAASFVVGVLDYRRVNLVLQPSGLLLLLAWVTVAIMRWRDGLRAARYVVFAWSALLAFAILSILSVDGVLPIRMGLAPQIGGALEAILFAMALADTARTRNEELSFANKELQRQIADRAGQLATALARLAVAPSRALATGDVIDERYRVIRAIGQGGMGTVYEVERLADRKRLALKTLARVADPRALARFAREAQVASALDHPNIVAVLDVDVGKSGMLFLVMPLVAGSSLDRVRDRYGDLAWARPIIAQIADALVAMHAHGIVHRDLKPSNVLLDGDRVKVTDFGIANAMASAPGDAAPHADTAPAPLTRTGHLVGTPLYMAPELADGAGATGPASDIFSLGVIAYELLSKQLPHAAPPIFDRLAGRIPEPPPRLATLAPSLPPELTDIVDRCLSHIPDDRPSAGELAAAFHGDAT